MAVVMASSDVIYQGLSYDEKPLGAGNGSLFHEVDTGVVWIFHEGMWLVDLRATRAQKPIG